MEKIKLEGVGRDDGLTLSALIHSFRNTEWSDGWEMQGQDALVGQSPETPVSEAKVGPATL